MKRKPNINLLFGLIVAAALLGGSVHVVHGFQENRNAGALLRRADREEKKGDLKQTEEFLGRYLVYRPDDADALARYGLLLDKRAANVQERTRAMFVLERALQRATKSDDALRRKVRRRAAELALSPELDRSREASEHLKILLRATPDDGELELLLARCHEDQAKKERREAADAEYRQARDLYEKAIAHGPGLIEGYVRLAALLRGPLGDPDQADRVMDAREDKGGVVARNPRSPRAYLERARYRRANGLPGPDEDVARALQLAPDDADAILAAADSALLKGDLDGVRTLLKKGEAVAPKEERIYQAWAVVADRAGRLDEGVAALRRGLGAIPDQMDLRWRLADLLVRSGKESEAREEINRLRGREDIPPAPLDYLEARLLIGKGRWQEAIPILEKARAMMAGNPTLNLVTIQADLLLARGYERLAQPERQLAASRRALELAPNWPSALLEQAAALRKLGRTDEAIEVYRRLVPGFPSARPDLARLLIGRTLQLPAERRREPAAWTEVEALLGQTEQADPGAIDVPLLRAEVLANRGRLEEAKARLEEVRKAHPDRVEPWTSLAILAEHRGKPEESLSLLEEAKRALGDRVELRVALAGYWGRRGGDAARAALAVLTKGLDASTPEDRDRLGDALADARVRLGDLGEAERLWGEAAERRPDDLRIATLLHDLAALRGDDEAMRRSTDRLRRIEGEDGVLWRYVDATRLIRAASPGDEKQLAAARALAAEVARRRPEWARVPLLEAELAEKERSPGRAIEGYLKAIRQGERPPQTIRRVVQLLQENGRTAEADRLIQDLVKQAPPAGILGQLAAEASLRHQDQGRALELARRAVAPDSKEYRDHLWLGQVLRAAGKPAEAEAEFRKALALAEAEPEAWQAWVQHLSSTGQRARAEQAIAEAGRKLPPDRAALTLAHCYQIIGARDRAEEQYRAARAAHPDDPTTLLDAAAFQMNSRQSKEAQESLRRVLDPRLKAPQPDQATARRLLALSLASGGGDPRQFLEALGLIDQNLRDEGDQATDRRLKALLLATRPGRRREAIATYEELARRFPPTPEEKFLLAQLHFGLRDYTRARDLLLGLAAEDGKSPKYQALLARVLIERGDAEEARPWIDKLEQSDPKGFAVVELKARLLHKEGKGREAVAALEARARAIAGDAGAVAGVLEELGEAAAAERLIRELVALSKDPRAVLVLARFLGARGRTREALDLCEPAWKTCPPEDVGEACLAILQAGRPDDGQRRRVAGWLDVAIRKAPDNLRLLFDLANLQIFRGDYPAAEALLRRLVARSPGSSGPLNNLAWLLAFRAEKLGEALDLAKQAIDLEGSAPGLLDTRGIVYLAMGEPGPALKDLAAAAAIDPSPTLLFHLARAQALADRRDAARESLKKAQAAGLDEETIHPLERDQYRQLVATLEPR